MNPGSFKDFDNSLFHSAAERRSPYKALFNFHTYRFRSVATPKGIFTKAGLESGALTNAFLTSHTTNFQSLAAIIVKSKRKFSVLATVEKSSSSG
jgi:hypothetical protein